MQTPTTTLEVNSLSTLLRGDPEHLRSWIETSPAYQLSRCVVIIAIGAGFYGAAIGYWRAPLQALFVATKLPLILLLTSLGNGLLNAMLAPLLGMNLGFKQSFLAILMSFTIAATILGALSPVAAFLVWNMPPLITGSQASGSTYNLIQLVLVAMIAFAGLAANLRLIDLFGSFSMGTQLWAAPVKVVGGLLVSALICLPSLYIFACLSGSQAQLSEISGLVAGLLLLMSILLVGFAPVAWLFSQSTESVVWMGALHLVFWFIASCFGLRFLQGGFSHSHARSTAGLNTWVIIFMLVAVQMTTALRPILGKSDTFLPKEKKLFLNHWGDCLKPLKSDAN